MTPPAVSVIRKAKVMEGDFWLKDNTIPKVKDRKGKCHVKLQTSRSDEVSLDISSIKSSSYEQVESKVLEPENWLVLFAETKGQVASLALVSISSFHESIILEARNENIAVLKMMEVKLRELLRVISYSVVIQELVQTNSLSQGIIHIFRDKVLVTQGFPPDLKNIVLHYLKPGDKGIMPLADQGLCFTMVPNVVLQSEQQDNIWMTVQGCIKEIGSRTTTTSPDLRPGGQIISTKQDEYTYHNLPRPCRYIYMNLPDNRSNFKNHYYVNVFNRSGRIYQNWQNSLGHEQNDNAPPLPPPRRPAPPRPPKPKNRPPKSPLPPIPSSSSASRSLSPPRLPLPRLPQELHAKEMQYVVYSSKPVVGQFWVIQVVFLQSNDDSTFKRIKKLEEESSYHLLKPLPEYIKVAGDFKISLFEMESGCTLKSDQHQVVEYEVVKEAVQKSCWMVIEFHLEHSELAKRNFHAKIVVEPVSKSVSMAKRAILISANFQDPQHQNSVHPYISDCNSLKSIGVRKYLKLCNLLDIPCDVHNNDWRGVAGEIGLTVDEVFKIQIKACYPGYSPTNEVLNIWSQKGDKICNPEQFRKILDKLRRFDVLSVLSDSS